MSDATYEPSAEAAPSGEPESSEAERRARQLAQFVEAERRRRRSTLRFYLALLVVPVALAAAGLLLARGDKPVSEEALRRQVTPIVEHKVDEQMRPVVEQKFGGQIDAVIEQRLGDKIQGASPARVRELGENVEQMRSDLSQLQEVKAALPEIRSQLEAQGSSVREIQATQYRQLQGRLNELEQKLDRTFTIVSKRMEENAAEIKSLKVKLVAPDSRDLPETRRANQ
ncbi:MAG TPA: hypothetical protein VFS10_00535 [Pyrinomonadaceae bacterium]|nr:hypothetical protein [Pyrinomonadaceae bacterium]